MKWLIASLFLLVMSVQASDFVIGDAYLSALDEANVELDVESIVAFSATEIADEVEVAVLGTLNGQSTVLNYGCHSHNSTIDCHKEDVSHFNSENNFQNGFNDFLKIHQIAVKKFETTLIQRKQNLSSIVFVKVWKNAGTSDHETNSLDIWTRFDFKQNNTIRSVFVQCHEHTVADVACHYRQLAENEPTF